MLKNLSILILLLVFTGCEDIYTRGTSGNTGSTAGTTNSSSLLSGIFVDSPVEGLYYVTSSGITGTTDSQGVFYYKADDTIRFKLSKNGPQLGETITAQSIITPLTLDNLTDIANITTTSTNIARFLQTADSDLNSSNGIKIDSNLSTYADGKSIDFGIGTSDFATQGGDAEDTYNILNHFSKTIITSKTAKTELSKNINLKYTSSILANSTLYGLWDLGSKYTVYTFGAAAGSTVTIQEQDLFEKKESNITGTWDIQDGKLVITRDGLSESISRLSTLNSDTHVGINSYDSKGLGSLQKNTLLLTNAMVSGSTLYFLRPDSSYAIYDCNTTNGGKAILPEDNNSTLTWAINSGNLEVNVTRDDTIAVKTKAQFITNRDRSYLAKETLDVNSSALFTNRLMNISTNGLKLHDTMIPGTYYSLSDKGFFMKLVLASDGTGTISFQNDLTDGEYSNGGSFPAKWSLTSANKLYITTKYSSYDTQALANISTDSMQMTDELVAVNNSMWLIHSNNNHAAFGDEYKVLFKKQPNTTLNDFAGTYNIFRDDYNRTASTLTRTQYVDQFQREFVNDGTGNVLNTSSGDSTPFTWSINSDGIISISENGTLQRTLTLLKDYRGTIRIYESYVNTPKPYHRIYTYIKN